MARMGLVSTLAGVLVCFGCSSESTNVSGGTGGTGGSAGASGGSAGATGGSAGATGGSAGAGGGTGGASCMPAVDSGPLGAWPDSITDFCTDGVAQISCPSSGQGSYGQDGTHDTGKPAYSLVGDEVTDSVTHLTWQKKVSGPLSQAAAAGYCSGLGAGWRLPTRAELTSIVDYGSDDPALPTTYFDPVPTVIDLLWTSELSKEAGKHFTLVPRGGAIGITNSDPGALKVFARCVKGPSGPQPVPNASCKVVLDPATGLMWKQEIEAAQTWSNALAKCEAMEHAGYGDWRMASIKELHTIVKVMGKGNTDPTIDVGLFGTTPLDLDYWSSTPYRTVPSEAWLVHFQNGTSAAGKTNESRYYRCVRSAP